jgi:di/tricarboxylate transporter
MVYSSGRVDATDFLKTGTLMGLIVPAIGAVWLWLSLKTVLGVVE